MSDLQLGPVAGKIGGGVEVETYPFTVTAPGSAGSTALIRSLVVPEGETWAVVVNATVNQGSTTVSSSPWLRIGDIYGRGQLNGNFGVGAIVTENTDIRLHRQTNTGSDTATGTVHIVKL